MTPIVFFQISTIMSKRNFLEASLKNCTEGGVQSHLKLFKVEVALKNPTIFLIFAKSRLVKPTPNKASAFVRFAKSCVLAGVHYMERTAWRFHRSVYF